MERFYTDICVSLRYDTMLSEKEMIRMELLPVNLVCPNCGARLKSKTVKICPKCGHMIIYPISCKVLKRCE